MLCDIFEHSMFCSAQVFYHIVETILQQKFPALQKNLCVPPAPPQAYRRMAFNTHPPHTPLEFQITISLKIIDVVQPIQYCPVDIRAEGQKPVVDT